MTLLGSKIVILHLICHRFVSYLVLFIFSSLSPCPHPNIVIIHLVCHRFPQTQILLIILEHLSSTSPEIVLHTNCHTNCDKSPEHLSLVMYT